MLIDDPADLDTLFGEPFRSDTTHAHVEVSRDHDMLNVEELLVFEALPVQQRTTLEHLCGITGLAVPSITGILTKLERHKLAEQEAGMWRKQRNT